MSRPTWRKFENIFERWKGIKEDLNKTERNRMFSDWKSYYCRHQLS